MISYDLSKFLKSKNWKIDDIIFVPAPRGNGIIMICPDGCIRDCEACCDKVEE